MMNRKKKDSLTYKIHLKLKETINDDLTYTGLNKIWSFLSGPIIVLLIPFFFNEEIQGYWFTIFGMNTLINFADLGFIFLVLQLSAHEFAFLSFDKNNFVQGDEFHLKKLASLFKFTLKRISIMSVCMFPIIFIYGFFVLSSQVTTVEWFWPFFLYIISLNCDFVLFNVLSFTEGCNSVAKIQRIRLIGIIIQTAGMVLFILFGFGLYSIAIPIFLKCLFSFFLLYKKYKHFYKKLFSLSKEFKFDWKKELFPLMFKYAISNMSGYLIFSIYTPIVFSIFGPIEAGKIGMTLSIVMSFLMISNIWIVSIMPHLNKNVALKKWAELDNLFIKRLILSLSSYFIIILFFIGFFLIFKNKFDLLNRFVDLNTLIVISVSFFFHAIINGLAIYLRVHKEEPLAIISLCLGVYCLISSLFCAFFLPIQWFMYGFLSGFLWATPVVFFIFKKKRKQWHS